MSNRPQLPVRLDRWASDLRNREPNDLEIVELVDEDAMDLSTLLTEAANTLIGYRRAMLMMQTELLKHGIVVLDGIEAFR